MQERATPCEADAATGVENNKARKVKRGGKRMVKNKYINNRREGQKKGGIDRTNNIAAWLSHAIHDSARVQCRRKLAVKSQVVNTHNRESPLLS